MRASSVEGCMRKGLWRLYVGLILYRHIISYQVGRQRINKGNGEVRRKYRVWY